MTNRANGVAGQSPIIIGAFILLLDLWIIYSAIISSRSIAFKLGWTITVIMFPFGGLMLYLPISILSSLSGSS
ncbi:hypothetical protein V8B55DRAFT_1473416 [Mucor lusitanicus]|uniref:Cardiolipin synthase N-terminal domain-containing protein n=1 Tax=Mucor circinelloides f. lusitanicus TaxID=29924 RepID=A0A8H4BHR1_MUCCL|nr:hypothetical protein FB192DRAFT_1374320 [Mucor lusitanicus]